MISISFDQNHRFSKKPTSLYEGLSVLSQVEDQLALEEVEESVHIRIYLNEQEAKRRKKSNFDSVMTLGLGYGYNLLEFIEEQVETHYSKEEAEAFIGLLASEIMDSQRTEQNPEPVEVVPQTNDQPKKQRKWLRPILIGIAGVILVTGLSYTGFQVYQGLQVTEAVEDPLSTRDQLESRLKEDSPEALADEYPEEIGTIATLLAEEKRFDELKSFNQEWPTPEGSFDLAFHQEDWETVISLDETSLTEERKVMLAYSFIQLDRLEEAEILNRTLKSEKLSVLITEQWMVRGIKYIQSANFQAAKDIQKELSDPYLEELIETGEACQEMIDFYKEQKDDRNKELWEKHLKNLGEEYFWLLYTSRCV
ncbi:hypothetical protein A5885_003564 [Enterococcus sp. 8E11_MSG4843]|uniref:hypothetical protein n=1 Tax=Enterococcus sp. 8E11_MSG4843 TaxID=1834190 RepID=UPI000B75F334|nr:hypothetical protein [Enterococcus sp. 8E11_MSG4843]OUZ28223.1 hypothetical protein A5885_003564 [Enterococcus sp. 8E11_MSG4843]